MHAEERKIQMQKCGNVRFQFSGLNSQVILVPSAYLRGTISPYTSNLTSLMQHKQWLPFFNPVLTHIQLYKHTNIYTHIGSHTQIHFMLQGLSFLAVPLPEQKGFSLLPACSPDLVNHPWFICRTCGNVVLGCSKMQRGEKMQPKDSA